MAFNFSSSILRYISPLPPISQSTLPLTLLFFPNTDNADNNGVARNVDLYCLTASFAISSELILLLPNTESSILWNTPNPVITPAVFAFSFTNSGKYVAAFSSNVFLATAFDIVPFDRSFITPLISFLNNLVAPEPIFSIGINCANVMSIPVPNAVYKYLFAGSLGNSVNAFSLFPPSKFNAILIKSPPLTPLNKAPPAINGTILPVKLPVVSDISCSLLLGISDCMLLFSWVIFHNLLASSIFCVGFDDGFVYDAKSSTDLAALWIDLLYPVSAFSRSPGVLIGDSYPTTAPNGIPTTPLLTDCNTPICGLIFDS